MLIVTLCIIGAWYVDRTRLHDENVRLVQQQELATLNNSIAQRDYYTRYAGAQKLANIGTIDSVPPLIFALNDPDVRICVLARDALEKITNNSFRNLTEKSDISSRPTLEEFQLEHEKWTDWYRSNYPNDVFEFTAVFRKSKTLKSEIKKLEH